MRYKYCTERAGRQAAPGRVGERRIAVQHQPGYVRGEGTAAVVHNAFYDRLPPPANPPPPRPAQRLEDRSKQWIIPASAGKPSESDSPGLCGPVYPRAYGEAYQSRPADRPPRPSWRCARRDGPGRRPDPPTLPGGYGRPPTAMPCGRGSGAGAASRSSPPTRPVSANILSIRWRSRSAISLSAPSAASKTGGSSPLATTSSRRTTAPPSSLPPFSSTGDESRA